MRRCGHLLLVLGFLLRRHLLLVLGFLSWWCGHLLILDLGFLLRWLVGLLLEAAGSRCLGRGLIYIWGTERPVS